jgi:hypothetical protein
MKKMCANKSMKEVVCSSTCSGVHGRISMIKPLDFYLG